MSVQIRKTRSRLLRLALWAASLPGPALAQELPAAATPTAGTPEPAIDVTVGSTGEVAEGWLTTSTNGFLDTRFGYTRVATDRLLPANDVPTLTNLTEANVQLKLRWKSPTTGREWGHALADASFMYQHGGRFFGRDGAGDAVRVADHGVAALHPAAILSELYGTWLIGEHAQLTLGKKRVVWGPGLATNPTDLLNPPKDPSDPALQRAGSWLARLEMPYDLFTVSLVAAAKVTRQYGGVPASLVWFPDAELAPTYGPTGQILPNAEDDRPHFATAARLYALVQETDLNAIWYMTQLYNDTFEYKHRFGLTASHVFFNALELHVEALGQTGSARRTFDPACTGDGGAAIVCLALQRSPFLYPKLDDRQFSPRVLGGARYMFGDNASLTLEYLYNGDGFNSAEFGNYVQGLRLLGALAQQGLPVASMLGGGASDPGSPQRFSFDPVRRHYALVSYNQMQIADDWSVNALLLLGLEDGSGQMAPTLTWSAREWLSLTAAGFVVVPGLRSQGGAAGGEKYTEFGAQPLHWRAFVSARAFY